MVKTTNQFYNIIDFVGPSIPHISPILKKVILESRFEEDEYKVVQWCPQATDTSILFKPSNERCMQPMIHRMFAGLVDESRFSSFSALLARFFHQAWPPCLR